MLESEGCELWSTLAATFGVSDTVVVFICVFPKYCKWSAPTHEQKYASDRNTHTRPTGAPVKWRSMSAVQRIHARAHMRHCTVFHATCQRAAAMWFQSCQVCVYEKREPTQLLIDEVASCLDKLLYFCHPDTALLKMENDLRWCYQWHHQQGCVSIRNSEGNTVTTETASAVKGMEESLSVFSTTAPGTWKVRPRFKIHGLIL